MHGVYNTTSPLTSTTPFPQYHLYLTLPVLTNEGQGNKKEWCNHSIKDALRYNLKLYDEYLKTSLSIRIPTSSATTSPQDNTALTFMKTTHANHK
jgi:hypothetical protein